MRSAIMLVDVKLGPDGQVQMLELGSGVASSYTGLAYLNPEKPNKYTFVYEDLIRLFATHHPTGKIYLLYPGGLPAARAVTLDPPERLVKVICGNVAHFTGVDIFLTTEESEAVRKAMDAITEQDYVIVLGVDSDQVAAYTQYVQKKLQGKFGLQYQKVVNAENMAAMQQNKFLFVHFSQARNARLIDFSRDYTEAEIGALTKQLAVEDKIVIKPPSAEGGQGVMVIKANQLGQYLSFLSSLHAAAPDKKTSVKEVYGIRHEGVSFWLNEKASFCLLQAFAPAKTLPKIDRFKLQFLRILADMVDMDQVLEKIKKKTFNQMDFVDAELALKKRRKHFEEAAVKRALNPCELLEDLSTLPQECIEFVQTCDDYWLISVVELCAKESQVCRTISRLAESALQEALRGTRYEAVLSQCYYATARVTMVVTEQGKVEFSEHAYWKLGGQSSSTGTDLTAQHVSNVHIGPDDGHVAAISSEDYQLICDALKSEIEALVERASDEAITETLSDLLCNSSLDVRAYARGILRDEMQRYLRPVPFLNPFQQRVSTPSQVPAALYYASVGASSGASQAAHSPGAGRR